MTTRNQKRRANANSKPTTSKSDGVDFVKQPIVALPAANPPSSASDLDGKQDATTNPRGNQMGNSNLVNSQLAVTSAAALKNPASSPAQPATPAPSSVVTPMKDSVKNTSSSPAGLLPATTAPAVAATPLKNTTSNPVLKDIFALKSGELKVVSPAVSKYFGFPAGPVEKLNFNDPKVADFFGNPTSITVAAAVPVTGASVQAVGNEVAALEPISIPMPIQNAPVSSTAVVGVVQTIGASVNAAGNEVAALEPISNPKTLQNPISTVPSTTAAALQPSTAVVGGSSVVNGSSARPNSEAAGNPSTQTTAPASWAGLFKGNRAPLEDTKMNPNYPTMTNENIDLNIDDLYDDDEEKRSLIGFFNGKFPGINAIQRIVDDWSRKCSFYRHNSGWLVFTFDEEKDCDIVLQEGPYYAFNKPLVLKRMPEYFDFSDEAYSSAPVWIQLPNLPLRAWKKSALEKICTYLGTPLHTDLVTRDKTKKSFARCLVEIDVSKDLPKIVCCNMPDGKILRQHVLYEETPTFCSNCKKLGHETEDCYVKNNGNPSLYVTRSKRETEKKDGNKSGTAGVPKGAAKGSMKQPNHAQNARKSAANGKVSGQVSQRNGVDGRGDTRQPSTSPKSLLNGDSLAANGAANEQVLQRNAAAGNLEGSKVIGQPCSTPIAPVPNNSNAKTVNNNNGKTIDNNPKVPGFVSTNSFGPLANEKVGSWAEDAEASNARNNNNQKKLNGRKN